MARTYYHRPKDNKPIPVAVGDGEVVSVPPRVYVEIKSVNAQTQRQIQRGVLVLRNAPKGAKVIRSAGPPPEDVSEPVLTEFAKALSEIGTDEATSLEKNKQPKQESPLDGPLKDFKKLLVALESEAEVQDLLDREQAGKNRSRWVSAAQARLGELDGSGE